MSWIGKHLAHGFIGPMLLGLPNLRQIGVAEIQDVKLEAEEWLKVIGVGYAGCCNGGSKPGWRLMAQRP